MQFRFPTGEAAKRFVRSLAFQFEDVACLRDGERVWVVDGTRVRSRDILRTAAMFGGSAA